MKVATLAIIVKDGRVLFGWKKTGEIGQQTLNGPGGKVEKLESLEDCVVRETWEEVRLRLSREHLEKVAILTFFAAGVADFEVHVFRTEHFEGEPQETADMVPEWHPVDDLPFAHMLESDPAWFARAVRGEKFRAHIFYTERARGFERAEFFPFV